ncbi:UNVERIFIED_ORG: hypothetical protein GGE64_000698 [Rhizobium etli]
MFTKFALVAVIFGYPCWAIACDPNESCSRCLVSVFGNCQVEGNDPLCEARKKACQVNIPVSIFAPYLQSGGPPPLQILRQCVDDISNCPSAIVGRLTYEAVRPIADAYRASLERQASGRWKSLPFEFADPIRGEYPSIELDDVRYATNIFTVHGQAITIGYEIYFPHGMDLGQSTGRKLMYHELQHVLQYENRGGVEPFLAEYIAKAAGKIVEERSFDVHDDIDLEAEANAKAESMAEGEAIDPSQAPKPGSGDHYLPRIDTRTIDACIKSDEFPEDSGTQCSKEAQQQIADAYCENTGSIMGATDWSDMYTPIRKRSVKFHRDSTSVSTGQWVPDDGGGAIFTSITCE